MNEAHFHLVVNHLPIIFPLVGIIILIIGLISKSDAVNRTAYIIFILGAISAIFSMVSGEGAEEVVEKINGVSETYIKAHEESAEIFAILIYILGGISIIELWTSIKNKSISNVIPIITIVFAFVVLFSAKQTGTTGGEIRHTEIKSGNSTPTPEINKTEKEDKD